MYVQMRWAYLRGLDEFVGLLVGASASSSAAARHVGGHVVRGGGGDPAGRGNAPPAQVEVHDVGRRPPLPMMVAAVPHLTRSIAVKEVLVRPGGRRQAEKQSLFTTTITKRHGDP